MRSIPRPRRLEESTAVRARDAVRAGIGRSEVGAKRGQVWTGGWTGLIGDGLLGPGVGWNLSPAYHSARKGDAQASPPICHCLGFPCPHVGGSSTPYTQRLQSRYVIHL